MKGSSIEKSEGNIIENKKYDHRVEDIRYKAGVIRIIKKITKGKKLSLSKLFYIRAIIIEIQNIRKIDSNEKIYIEETIKKVKILVKKK